MICKINKYLKENNLMDYEVIEFDTVSEPITLRHSCGHTYEISNWQTFEQGNGRCPECRREYENLSKWIKSAMEEKYIRDRDIRDRDIKSGIEQITEVIKYNKQSDIEKTTELISEMLFNMIINSEKEELKKVKLKTK